MLFKLFTVYVFVQSFFCGCGADNKYAGFTTWSRAYDIKKIGRLDKTEVPESSGLARADHNNFWTHADGGNPPELYKINLAGELLQTLPIPTTQNLDWEDLAQDQKGYLYIGDFGNNQNLRQNLSIFRISEKEPARIDTITFRYADQKDFPPEKEKLNFDCEAFFYHQGQLYLFSKNRGRHQPVKLYQMPALPGNYTARVTDSISLRRMITAADISPDGKTIALLGYGNIYLLQADKPDNWLAGRKYCIPFPQSGQAEALVFINNTDFIITNEGGKIFKAVKRHP